MTLTRRQEIAETVRVNNLILIEDDSCSFLKNSELPPLSALIPEQSIYINCTSKSLSAGLRVAFMAVAPRFLDPIRQGVFNININTSHFNVEIVANLIATGLADQILEAKRLEAAARNKLTEEILRGFTVLGNRRDYFRWLLLPDGWTGKEFEYCARAAGVQVYCAERFAVGSNPVPAAGRMATASAKDHNELNKGLTILKKILEQKSIGTSFFV
jgi:DNA-binding transcriptional MocR family regulator